MVVGGLKVVWKHIPPQTVSESEAQKMSVSLRDLRARVKERGQAGTICKIYRTGGEKGEPPLVEVRTKLFSGNSEKKPDQFNRLIGRKESLRKALNELSELGVVEVTPEIRKEMYSTLMPDVVA